MPPVDILTATAADLRALLENKQITSVELAKWYLKQIETHNKDGLKLNAIISVAPTEEILEIAGALDAERSEKGSRGPFHGIPIIVKDSFCTPSLHMGATCGSFALKGATASRDADIIEKAKAAGMIIIGKTNMSELGSSKGFLITSGWSAVGGQAQSPYVRGGVLKNATFMGHSTPCGSASGSAIGVAAGFAPVALGTEVDGSLVQPATRAALYGLKCSLGSTNLTGIQAGAKAFSSLGGMAKSVEDLAGLLTLIQGKDYTTFLTRSWEGLRIGFVNPDLWQAADFVVEPNEGYRVETYKALADAILKIRESGGDVQQPVPLVSLKELTSDPRGIAEIEELMGYEFVANLEEFLALFDNPNKVYTIKDLVEFNRNHADLELPPDHPGQEILENAAKGDRMSEEKYNFSLKLLRDHATTAIQKTLSDHKIDVIMGPADARMASVAASAGYPIATVPLGFASLNGRAFGVNVLGAAGSEGKMLKVMSAWEATFPQARQPPPMLIDWDHKNGDTNAGMKASM